MAMTDKEFDAFVPQCVEQFNVKQKELREVHGLGSYDSWWFDQTTGLLQFKDSNSKLCAECDAFVVGSYSTKSATWKWGWANMTCIDTQRMKAERIIELAEITGISVFKQPILQADEQMAWELAAMSVHHVQALGCYRGPAKHLYVFHAIETIRLLSKDEESQK